MRIQKPIFLLIQSLYSKTRLKTAGDSNLPQPYVFLKIPNKYGFPFKTWANGPPSSPVHTPADPEVLLF